MLVVQQAAGYSWPVQTVVCHSGCFETAVSKDLIQAYVCISLTLKCNLQCCLLLLSATKMSAGLNLQLFVCCGAPVYTSKYVVRDPNCTKVRRVKWWLLSRTFKQTCRPVARVYMRNSKVRITQFSQLAEMLYWCEYVKTFS